MVIQSPNRTLVFFGATLLLIGFEVLLARSAVFWRNPSVLSLAVLFDITVVPTGLFYRLIIRPKSWSPVRMGLLALPMFRIGLFILPANALPTMLTGPALLVLAEVGALVLAGIRLSTIRRTYLKLRPTTTTDEALYGALTAVFGQRGASILVGEWQIIRYVTVGWWLQTDVPAGAVALTTHRDSGQVALTTALGVVCLIELVGVHLLLTRWNASVALWLTLASAYSLLMLMADIVATLKRPSYQTTDALHLRLGIRWQAVIQKDHIERIERIHEKPTRHAGLLNVALLTPPNLLLTLREPVSLRGVYGIRREATQLALWIDGGTAALA